MNTPLRTLASVAAFCAGFTIVSAQAADGPYVGLSALGSMVSDIDFDNDNGALSVVNTAELDPGYGAFLKGGYRFGSMRAELELGYRKLGFNNVASKTGTTGDVDALTAMINGAWDFQTESSITPYISLGFGILNVDGDLGYNDATGRAQSKNFDGTAPAGQIGIGASYGLTPDIDLVGGYSLLGAPTGKTGQDEIITIHTVQLGLNYKF